MFSVDIQPDEKVFKIYRQSEWVLAKTVILIFVLIYVPFFLVLRNELLLNFAKLLIAWVIIVFLFGLNKYILWLINSYVITDKRLIIIRYQSIFKKHVDECPLDKILHISYATTGFFSSLLNYGNLELRVAGLDLPLTLHNIRKPEDLKNFLWALHSHQETASNEPKH